MWYNPFPQIKSECAERASLFNLIFEIGKIYLH